MNTEQQINNNPSLKSARLLADICSPLSTLGVGFFGYTAVDAANQAFCLGSRTDYAFEYLAKQYAARDVHCEIIPTGKKPCYIFWDHCELDETSRSLYRFAAEFGHSHTLTIAKHDKLFSHYYHFSGDTNNADINHRYLESLDALHLFIDYFHACLQQIPELHAVYQQPMTIEKSNTPKTPLTHALEQSPQHLSLESLEAQPFQFQNENLYLLSDQERKCLRWINLGKSYEMIADIMDVSCKSVERYVASIKAKYESYTLFQLGKKMGEKNLSMLLNLKHPA